MRRDAAKKAAVAAMHTAAKFAKAASSCPSVNGAEGVAGRSESKREDTGEVSPGPSPVVLADHEVGLLPTPTPLSPATGTLPLPT
jgi:hypothetical protein